MSRFIDADALKSKFIPHSEYYSDSVIDAIEIAPSIDIPAWIPNEQRLPKYNKRVLVCTEDGDIYIGYRSRLLRKGGEPLDCMRDMYGYPIVCPDAWMPLPEPWKGADDEHK